MLRIVSILTLFLFTSFHKESGVEISFVNDSEETFLSMTIKTDGKEFQFCNIRPGERTKPVVVSQTYWFCYTEVVTQLDTIKYSGFCTVGETKIKDGTLIVSYSIYPKKGEHRVLYASEVSYSGTAKNVGFEKVVWKERD